MKVTKRQKIKLTLTLSLSLLSVVLFAIKPSTLKLLCISAMIASNFGDITLMDLKPITKHFGKNIFKVGIVFFGIAHLLYIILYALKAILLGASLNAGTLLAIGLTLCAVCMLIIICFVRKRLTFSLVFLGIIYILILSITLCTISTIAFSFGGWFFLTLFGALSFFISDMIIAFNTALGHSGGEIPVWILYFTGQLFLILGA